MVSPHATLEGMQTKAGDIHALRAGTSVEGSEDTQEFRGVPLGNPRRPALLIELPQAAMPECPDHWQKVWCLSTIVNYKERSAEALVCNAGVDRESTVADASDEDICRIVAINTLGREG